MRGVFINIGIVYFVGIGGIGMLGIVEVMDNFGYEVQGFDVKESVIVEWLCLCGIWIVIGYVFENVENVVVVVMFIVVK